MAFTLEQQEIYSGSEEDIAWSPLPLLSQRQDATPASTGRRGAGAFVAVALLLGVTCLFQGDMAHSWGAGRQSTQRLQSQLLNPSFLSLAAAETATCGTPHDGMQNTGMTFRFETAIDMADCCNMCLKTEGCKGYTFVQMMSQCGLKSNVGIMTPDFSAISGTIGVSTAVPVASPLKASAPAAPVPLPPIPTTLTSNHAAAVVAEPARHAVLAAPAVAAVAVVPAAPALPAVTTRVVPTSPAPPAVPITSAAPALPAATTPIAPATTPGTPTAPGVPIATTLAPQDRQWLEKCLMPQKGMDNGGSLLSTVAATDWGDCCKQCTQTTGCKGYTWVHAASQCRLKSRVDQPHADEYYNTISGSVV